MLSQLKLLPRNPYPIRKPFPSIANTTGFISAVHPGFVLVMILLSMLPTVAGCKARNTPNTTPQMDTDPRYWVRVLLVNNSTEFDLSLDTGFAVATTGSKGPPQVFPKQEGSMKVSIIAGRIAIGELPVHAFEVDILPDPPHIIGVNGSGHRGQLRISVNSDGRTIDAINMVPLEPYLAGVVGAEMPQYWEPAALQAQAIAARTYCLYTKNRFGKNRTWDLSRTQASQVYKGVDGESERIWDAVTKTRGMVLTAPTDDGTTEVFPAYYSSTCGGHTEDCAKVFGESFTGLTPVPCPYCKDVAKPKSFFWPIVKLDKTRVTELLSDRYPNLRGLGQITVITPVGLSQYEKFSRITRVELQGSTGSRDYLRGEDFRLSLDPSGRKLRSTAFEIQENGDQWEFTGGRGWGHGVGMCQCGVQGMARQGKTVEEILQHYYPKAKLVRLY